MSDTAPSITDEQLEKAERLLHCECGHDLGEHNGLGCYARLSYQPLISCTCPLTDNRTHAELLAPRLARMVADAWNEGHRAGTLSQTRGTHAKNPYRVGDP